MQIRFDWRKYSAPEVHEVPKRNTFAVCRCCVQSLKVRWRYIIRAIREPQKLTVVSTAAFAQLRGDRPEMLPEGIMAEFEGGEPLARIGRETS
jgi:hypothetical protein